MSTPKYSREAAVPRKEGWFWAKGHNGWICIRTRMLEGRLVGLNPHTGEEYPLHFPDDEHWDMVLWHGEAVPPAIAGAEARKSAA